jgi:hypothetical protein
MNATIRDLDAVPTVPPVPVSWLLKLPYPVRTVIRRWRGLTGMVIGVGIALGIGMLFLGVSKSKVDLYSANFVRVAADLYVVQRGGTLVPILPSDTTGSIAKASGVIAQVRAIKEVRTVVGIALAGLEQERESARNADEPAALVTVMGVDGDPSQIDGLLVLKQGRWLRRPDEVMVGTTGRRPVALERAHVHDRRDRATPGLVVWDRGLRLSGLSSASGAIGCARLHEHDDRRC